MSGPRPRWTPLAERLPSLPLILAGPILRRTQPQAVTVWVALREARQVTLHIYRWDAATGQMTERLSGSRQTVRLGKRLHIAAVTASAPDAEHALEPGELYCYDLSFADKRTLGAATTLGSPGVLVSAPGTASEVERLVYPGIPLPSFVLPASTLDQVHLFHGSCRNPRGVGRDALATLDTFVAASATDPHTRPQQLYLTGDQIYADDVAMPLLPALMDAAETLVGPEALPEIPPGMNLTAPGRRAWVVHELARFTTTTAANHLLTRGEYLVMYLFVWSEALWPTALPTPEEMWQAYPQARPEDGREREQALARWRFDANEVANFRATLPYARRALANTPTYTVCDDHDITDDWYLDGAWCANVLGSPLGRRILRNGLYAYALCQAWGNDPEQFGRPNGQSFLALVDRWRGDEAGVEEGADAALLAEYLALPEEFSGMGTLPRSERALHWHYTVETPAYRMHVLDERTRRIYETPSAAPGLLCEEAMETQIGAPIPGDQRLTMLVAQTPVLGVDVVEKLQLLSLDHYAYDRESWSLNRHTYLALLRRLERFGSVVILSGDVHYGFGSTLECWERLEGTQSASVRGAASIVNFTSSALKNAAAGVQKALLTAAYPHLFHLLSRGRMPPIDLFVWDEGTRENAGALAAAGHAVRLGALAVWWSVPRVATLLRSPAGLMLPAHGWPAHVFDASPPAQRLRLRYLHDARGADEGVGQGSGRAAALEELDALHATHDQRVRETVAALTSDAHLGVDKALTVLDDLDASQQPHAVQLGVVQRLWHLAQNGFPGDRLLSRLHERLNGGISHLLATAVTHPEIWTRVWSDGGLHIVGDANIGEIRFGEHGQHTEQRLWWYPPNAPDGAPDATVYRASLHPPLDADAPALP